MKSEPASLLAAIRSVLDEESSIVATRLLQEKGVCLLSILPSRGIVSQLLPSLQARLINSTRTANKIYGLNSLIANLEGKTSTTIVMGYSVNSPHAGGTFYFSEHDEGLGAMIVRDD
jgi:hypothetical protein